MSELSVPLRPACLKEGHPPLLLPLSLLIPLVLPLAFTHTHTHTLLTHSARAGLRADVQTLSFRLRPRCQLRALLPLVACPGSFFPLSPRPAAREDLIKLRSFSPTSVNFNSVTQVTLGESEERLPRSKDCAFRSELW